MNTPIPATFVVVNQRWNLCCISCKIELTVIYWGKTVGAIKFSTVTTAVPNAEK
ncbi:hypothetical protein [Flavobacterium sp. YO64]|uniref:hypothetical protein n=1 Tax=Flavobacterium sp. YO64 TaxID=394559 RepID=UPI0013E90DFD|nr:hypothetical protein [Flavobacterium sp. YO64]